MPTENKRASAEVHTAKASPPKKRQHTISQSQDRSSDSFQGFNFCNLGGSGDCAYRALAAAFAFQSERDPKEAVSASQQLGATLRAQISSQLENIITFEALSQSTAAGLRHSKMVQSQKPTKNGSQQHCVQTGGSTALACPPLPLG